MNKKQFLRSLNDVYCRLAPSKNGVGVFAVRDIPKGTDPFKNCDNSGYVLKVSENDLEAASAPEAAKKMVRDFCALQDGIYFVPSYGIDAIDKSFFLNHSKKPNMIPRKRGEIFVTARGIKNGEELTANYDAYHHTKHFRRR